MGASYTDRATLPGMEKPSVLTLLERALEALDRSPSDHAHAEAAAITEVLGEMGPRILAEAAILEASGKVPVPILMTLFSHPSPQVCAWARTVVTAREVGGG